MKFNIMLAKSAVYWSREGHALVGDGIIESQYKLDLGLDAKILFVCVLLCTCDMLECKQPDPESKRISKESGQKGFSDLSLYFTNPQLGVLYI